MRIVSLLPAATELLYAAGGGDLLVGRSHGCDWPPPAQAPALQRLPALTRAQAPHAIDEAALAALRPDLILTQDLCQACGVDRDAVERVAAGLPTRPRVISFAPRSLWQVLDDLLLLGEAIGRPGPATHAATQLRDRAWTAAEQASPFTDGPGVLFLEWIDPPFVGGHWTPELIAMAGGAHPLNAPGAKSRRVDPAAIVESAPERVVVCPCSVPLDAVRAAMPALAAQPWWRALPAVRDSREKDSVMLVDGDQMFNRPGPRLVDALEWLAAWINGRPEIAPPGFPCERWQAPPA